MIGKAVSCTQSFEPSLPHTHTHTGAHKNGSLAWDTSLLTDKEPTQPVLGLSLYVEISCPISCLMSSLLFCLKYMHYLTGGRLHCFICSPQGGDTVLPLNHKRSVCRPISLHQPPEWIHWP